MQCTVPVTGVLSKCHFLISLFPRGCAWNLPSTLRPDLSRNGGVEESKEDFEAREERETRKLAKTATLCGS